MLMVAMVHDSRQNQVLCACLTRVQDKYCVVYLVVVHGTMPTPLGLSHRPERERGVGLDDNFLVGSEGAKEKKV